MRAGSCTPASCRNFIFTYAFIISRCSHCGHLRAERRHCAYRPSTCRFTTNLLAMEMSSFLANLRSEWQKFGRFRDGGKNERWGGGIFDMSLSFITASTVLRSLFKVIPGAINFQSVQSRAGDSFPNRDPANHERASLPSLPPLSPPQTDRRKEESDHHSTMSSGFGFKGREGRCYRFWKDVEECSVRFSL